MTLNTGSHWTGHHHNREMCTKSGNMAFQASTGPARTFMVFSMYSPVITMRLMQELHDMTLNTGSHWIGHHHNREMCTKSGNMAFKASTGPARTLASILAAFANTSVIYARLCTVKSVKGFSVVTVWHCAIRIPTWVSTSR